MFRSRVLGLAIAGLAFVAPAMSQEIGVPEELLQKRLNRDGQALNFCFHDQPMLGGFHAAVAQAIADVLLIEAKVTPIRSLFPPEALDYRIPFDADELYLMLTGRCNAFLGFTLTTDYPTWLLVTRPYFSTDNVLVVTDPSYNQLSDIPRDRPIGTRMFSSEDAQLTMLIAALPEAQRWRRHPYRNYGIALERVIDGTVGGSIIWEAAVYHQAKGDPAGQGMLLRPMPFSTTKIELGIGVPSNERYLESTLSEAISVLETDGTLNGLAQQFNLSKAD